MKKINILLIFLSLSLWAAQVETNQSQESNLTKPKIAVKVKESAEEISRKKHDVKVLKEELDAINNYLNKDILYAKYNNHQTYITVQKDLNAIKAKLKKAKLNHKIEEIAKLQVQEKSLQNQLELLNDFRNPPFLSLTKPNDLKKQPEITSPFHLFKAFAYLKQLKSAKDEYSNELKNLSKLIQKLQEKENILLSLQKIYGSGYKEELLKEIRDELKQIRSAYDIANSTNRVYNKKVNDAIINVTSQIKEQIKKLINVALTILLIFVFSFIFKYFAKKTITDNQRYYMAHKVINFTNLFLVTMVLLFYFLENATYLVTVLGFASAGIAIAMKDLFMSMLGWFVIVFGGSFHVGDRIKVYKGGKSYVGDIVDISFLRMTILEDITLTSYVENRRSGRVVFIPNNYVFTELLANYTHGKIKTVWDGIDIPITFDSNHKKASHIAREIVRKYAKGYTDISRKQLNLLRNQYSLKNINVDPRVYTFIEKNGIVISCWYMTNSYAALTLRSNMSALIIDEFNKEEDIKIAYDTHIVNYKKDEPLKPKKGEGEEESIS
jgi:small-conductance mechanosensitive channel